MAKVRRKRLLPRRRSLSRRSRRFSSTIMVGNKLRVRRGVSTVRKYKRHKNASTQNLNIREVQRVEGEPYEYAVYLFTTKGNPQKLHQEHQEVVEFVRSCLAGQYKIYKQKIDCYPTPLAGVKCIKLECEADLMMFMLCHREAIRKIFKMVDEPATGSSFTD